MDIITIDFETYYDKEFSLSKLTTEEYIRGKKFHVIGVAVKVNNNPTEWASGTHEQLKRFLRSYDWENSVLVAHNTMFDGAILNWVFGIVPKAYADTLCMARAIRGIEVGGSLAKLVEEYGLGEKGTAVLDAIGKNRLQFTEEELSVYGDYCVNDVELTYKLFKLFAVDKKFPVTELKLIDVTLRMFVIPVLELDALGLKIYLEEILEEKNTLLSSSGVSKEDLMSNLKFAEVLKTLGVDPPIKISPTTDKPTYAFAKTDDGMQKLLEHPDIRVQAVAAARLGTKGTLGETRAQRFIEIAERGNLSVPIKYYAAHTGRWGGDDKINLQNLPSRGGKGKNQLKNCIHPPAGYVLIEGDSSQIEARILAWLAGQSDLVDAFTNGEDVYKKMAARIYSKSEFEVTEEERFVGKSTILGAGYGMGAARFQEQLKSLGHILPLEECRRIIKVYRDNYKNITRLWQEAKNVLVNLCNKQNIHFGVNDLLLAEDNSILLPSGLRMTYADLKLTESAEGMQFTYRVRNGRTNLFGGKVVENICQALARIIIGYQILQVSKKYRVVLTVHDSIIICVPESEKERAVIYMRECMRRVPAWAKGLPITCEIKIGKTYGGMSKV